VDYGLPFHNPVRSGKVRLVDNTPEIELAIRNRSEGLSTQSPDECVAYGDP
jgi:hypothetical protein